MAFNFGSDPKQNSSASNKQYTHPTTGEPLRDFLDPADNVAKLCDCKAHGPHVAKHQVFDLPKTQPVAQPVAMPITETLPVTPPVTMPPAGFPNFNNVIGAVAIGTNGVTNIPELSASAYATWLQEIITDPKSDMSLATGKGIPIVFQGDTGTGKNSKIAYFNTPQNVRPNVLNGDLFYIPRNQGIGIHADAFGGNVPIGATFFLTLRYAGNVNEVWKAD